MRRTCASSASIRSRQGMPLFELHHVFVRNSKELEKRRFRCKESQDAVLIAQQAHVIRAGLKGAKGSLPFSTLWSYSFQFFH